MATFISGKNAKIRVAAGAATLTHKKWQATYEAVEHETTNSEGAGFYESISGTKKLSGTIDLDWDGAVNPFDSTLALVPGGTIASVKLYINDTSGPYWDCGTVRVNRTVNVGQPSGGGPPISLQVEFTSQGTFVDPTGTTS